MYEKQDDEKIMEYLMQIPDPRERRGVRYKYADLLLIYMYAVLTGCSNATEIAYYAELKYRYFQELLGIDGIPSHDTFSRIMRMTDFEKLSESLQNWLAAEYPDICERYCGMKILHVDGKAVRAAGEKSRGEKPVYHLNAMYEGESIGVKIERIGEKENEISALPEFLGRFNLKDTIVTVDAIGCNRTVIGAIEKGGGKYVVPVKENNLRLLRSIEKKIRESEENGEWDELERTSCLKKEHGRIESTEMRMIKDTSFIYEELGAEGIYGTIARVGVMDKKVTANRKGKESVSRNRSILITDVEDISVENLLKIKAAHWNIEMQHWLLDVQLREDMHTAGKGNAATNSSILRRFCLMVKEHDRELSKKPMSRFLMANAHDVNRIERLLFGEVANENHAEDAN